MPHQKVECSHTKITKFYTELFSDNLTNENLHSKKTEDDFDLPKVINNAVNVIKEQSDPYSTKMSIKTKQNFFLQNLQLIFSRRFRPLMCSHFH